MDHIEVLMRLYEAAGQFVALTDLERQTRLGPETTAKAASHLVGVELARHDPASQSFAYHARTPADRAAVDALSVMYHQRPVTLVRIVYEQPPKPVQSFADAFRLRDEPESDR